MKMIHVIAIVLLIIVPMALILTAYSNSQLKTIQYQVAYDTKLRNSTYDAIKAFQLNMSNSSTSNLANSKIRDLEASANVFYTSLSNNFTANGYTKETIKNYVPALVYTLYDGYYIYSPYENTLDGIDLNNNSEYSPGDLVYGLKPYIYYSCRYKPNNTDSDFVITYSLDSYITIQGKLDGQPINKSGYLLTGVNKSGTKYQYGNIDIEIENGNLLQENIYIEDYKDSKVEDNNTTVINHYEGKCIKAPHIKYQGTKYYLQGDNEEDVGYKYKDYESGHIFHMLNEERLDTDAPEDVNNDSIINNRQAIQYYEDAYEFKEFIKNNNILNSLKSNDAVRINGEKYDTDTSPFTQGISIFGELDGSESKYIEDKDSDFYLHRTEVIKNAIESNLMVAIDNFNKVSSSSTQFAMPRLTESDWENLTNGISMISFLQGLSIGGKIYNSYSIVSNDVNDDYVGENSIYIVINGNSEKEEERGTYYLPTDNTLKNIDLTNAIGVFNTNFEQRTIIDTIKAGDVEKKYEVNYLPRVEYAAYTSVINPGDSENSKKTVSELMKEYANSTDMKEREIARKYYMALGRERQGMYRILSDIY